MTLIEGGEKMVKNNIRKIFTGAIIFLFIATVLIPISTAFELEKDSNKSTKDPPVILDFVWKLSGSKQEGWTITFLLHCYDETSGMDRVEFSLDDELQHIDDSPPTPYEWILEDPFDIPDWKTKIIKATAFDKAGNSDFAEIPASEITVKSRFILINHIISDFSFYKILQHIINLYL